MAQDLRDGGRRDGDAEPVQFARDPLVAPGRVLARQPEYQCADLLVDRRPTAPTDVGPAAGDEPPAPAQQCRWRNHERPPVRPKTVGELSERQRTRLIELLSR
jgi:hypothetical protein